MIHIPAGQENIDRSEMPDYRLVEESPWWKRHGWRLLPIFWWFTVLVALWTWVSAWTRSGGFESNETFLFLLPTPTTPSDQWRRNVVTFEWFGILFIFLFCYGGVLVSHGLMWWARKWQFRYEVNASAWNAFRRSADSIKSTLAPEERVLCYTRSQDRLTEGLSWFDAGIATSIGVAILLLLGESFVEALVDGEFYVRRFVLPWLLYPATIAALIHVTRGIRPDAFLSALFLFAYLFVTYVGTRLLGAPVLPVQPIWIAGILTVVELFSLVLLPRFELVAITSQRLLVITPQGLLRSPRVVAVTARLGQTRGDKPCLKIHPSHVGCRRHQGLYFPRTEMTELLDASRDLYPDLASKVPPSQSRWARSLLPQVLRQILGLWFVTVMIGAHAGDCLFSCAATYRLLLPPIFDLAEGRPEKLYDNCKFVLSIMPDIPVAESLEAYAAWNMDRLDEAAQMGSRALKLTASKGKTGILTRNVVLMAEWERKAMEEWKQARHKHSTSGEEAARELFIAERLAKWRADSRGAGFVWQHAKIHLERALKLDRSSASEVTRLKRVLEKAHPQMKGTPP